MTESRDIGIADVRRWVHAPAPTDHKYSRGVAGLVTGSSDFPGAGLLSAAGALHGGCGMVRYTGPELIRAALLSEFPEIVAAPGRVDALAAGCGISDIRDDDRLDAVREAIADAGTPVVIDAGALSIVDSGSDQFGCVLTPHAGELASLAKRLLDRSVDDPTGQAMAVADESGAVVLLKGSTTRVCVPGNPAVLEVHAPCAWLATAGAGDVLAGLMAALLATANASSEHDLDHVEIAEIAAAAAWIHAWAAAAASLSAAGVAVTGSELLDPAVDKRACSGGPIRALDVARFIPLIIAEAS